MCLFNSVSWNDTLKQPIINKKCFVWTPSFLDLEDTTAEMISQKVAGIEKHFLKQKKTFLFQVENVVCFAKGIVTYAE